ncbi:MAG: ATP-binding cassette domain-containing protein [Peptococcaceae bacterium]|nr:ATP-binding cassette domain-containing protein [Peptococcaceae bacterium]
MSANTMIKLENVTKVFDGREVIHHCSMNVPKGSIYGFVGPNGAGKTTILKLIMGLLRPTTGRISVMGIAVPLERNRILQKIGCIIEAPVFYEDISAEKNLRLHLEYMKKQPFIENIPATLHKVGLDGTANQPVRKFSLGMKQRLGIARAIIHRPEILLLDEPINGLDPMGIKEMRELFCSLAHEQNMTIIISSHILSELENIADLIGIISKGQISKEIFLKDVQKDFPIDLEKYFFEAVKGNEST